MKSTSRLNDIRAMLNYCNIFIHKIQSEYEIAKKDSTLANIDKIAFQITVSQLRNSLDFLAQDIAAYTKSPHVKKKCYFPYGANQSIFDDSIKRGRLIDLQSTDKAIYSIIYQAQPFNCNSNWLTDVCSFCNQNKHDSLSKQSRVHKEKTIRIGNFIEIGRGAQVTLDGCHYNGKRVGVNFKNQVRITSNSTDEQIREQINNGVGVTFENENVKFYVEREDGSKVDILELLQKAYDETSALVSTAYSLMDPYRSGNT